MKFLAVTDLHFTDNPTGDADKDKTESLNKLNRILAEHADSCDFVMNLGDTADGGIEKTQSDLIKEVCKALKSSGKPFYSIIGNHDTSIEKNTFCGLMEMSGRYYSFVSGGYRCVVLDACLNDIAKPYPDAEIDWDNCYVDLGQLEWLKSELSLSKEPVLLFTHIPLMLEKWDIENPHLVKNRAEVVEIFEHSGKVKAVFSGHYHEGCQGTRNDIPHIVFGAVCMLGYETFAIVELSESYLKIEGIGLNKSTEFTF